MMSQVKKLRVAVVGAGAAGLCAARHLLSRQETFAPPIVFELTDHVGGTWVYEERVGTYENGLPVHSSMYRDLRTNLPKEVMMFPDFPFDPHLPSFLPHQEVLRYLEGYCESHGIKPHIRFGTVVEKVKPVAVDTGEGKMTWEVTFCSKQGGLRMETFDSVFICNGHYSNPHVPSIPGLSYFKGLVIHSHSYRYPEKFAGQSVVVLGAGASGVDIAIELADVNAQVILSHNKTSLTYTLPPVVRQAPPITQVLEDGSLQFQDGDLVRPQVLLLCTGYNFSYPFLETAKLGLQVEDKWVSPLYRFLIPPAFPSLFLVGVCKIICPFPHFHCQVLFALAVLEGSIALPSPSEMEEDIRSETEKKRHKGVEIRHLLNLDSDQWEYSQALAKAARFQPLPPVTQSLYEEVKKQRQKQPQKYRLLNYRLVSDTQWELLELHSGNGEGNEEEGKGK